MNLLIKKITSYFYDEEINHNEIAVFQYGLEAILSSFYCLGISFLLCVILGEDLFGVFYLVFLSVLKMQFTSYHAKTRIMCCLTYNFITIINVFAYKQNIEIPVYIPILILLSILLLRKNELCSFNVSIIMLYIIIICTSYLYYHSVYLIMMLVSATVEVLILLKNCRIKPKTVD